MQTSGVFLAAMAVAAALNGVLAQIVMASRVLFGLGRRSPTLEIFYHAHPRFGTPVLGTVLIGAVVIGAALTLPVATLAEVTTMALLIVFAIVNAALIGVKRKLPDSEFSVSVFWPWLGILLSLGVFVASILGDLL